MRSTHAKPIIKPIVLFLIVTLTLLYSPVVSFAAGGDFSLDFVAAAPHSYDHSTGGGAYDDRTIGRDADVVESLEGGDFAKGDIVTYFVQVVVDDTDQAAADAPQTIEMDFEFLADSTGQSGLAQSDIVNVEVNYGSIQDLIAGEDSTDSGISDDGGSVATLINEYIDGTVFDNGVLHGTVRLTDLEPAEKVVVRIDVLLDYKTGSRPTGNLQADLTDARVTEIMGEELAEPDAISSGKQTIPFKNVDRVYFPSIDVEKLVSVDGGNSWEDADSAPGPTLMSGTDPQFKFIITNTNGATLSNLTLNDNILGPITLAVSSLGAGEFTEVIITGTWAAGQHTNIATATGEYDGTQYSDEDPANYFGSIPADPSIMVIKEVFDGNSWVDANVAPGPTLLQGTTPQFRFTITNTGNVVLTGLTLVDNVLGAIILPVSSLEPGIYTMATADGTWAEGQHTNIATTSAMYGETPVTDDDPANYKGVIPADPSIMVLKEVYDGDSWVDANNAPGPTLLQGSTPQFRFTITNTGNVTLTGLTLTDNVLGAITLPVSSLAPGANTVVEASGTWAVGQHTNIATASGMFADTPYTDDDPANYMGVIPSNPAIQVTKYVWDGDSWDDANSTPGPTLSEGTTPQFRFVVMNIGNVALSAITLSDNVLGAITLPVSSLDPGGSTFAEISGSWASGQHTNIASVSGMYGETPYTDTDPANYYGDSDDNDGDPDVDLIKDVDQSSATAPGTFVFTITIRNVGDTTFSITDFTDTNVNPLPVQLQELIGMELKVGQSVTRSYTIVHSDVGTYPNTAVVKISDVNGKKASDNDSETVTVQSGLIIFGAEMPQTGDSGLNPFAVAGLIILIVSGLGLLLLYRRSNDSNH